MWCWTIHLLMQNTSGSKQQQQQQHKKQIAPILFIIKLHDICTRQLSTSWVSKSYLSLRKTQIIRDINDFIKWFMAIFLPLAIATYVYAVRDAARYLPITLLLRPICIQDPTNGKHVALIVCGWLIHHIETWTKWPTFCRRYFQLHFLEWKSLFHFLEVCF